METTMAPKVQLDSTIIITPDQMLEHWQGHRRLTRRVIEAFPEKELFEFSIGGMRPFSSMVLELLQMDAPGVKGIATKKWNTFEELTVSATTKADLLRLWDESTALMNEWWPKITPEHFQENDMVFKLYEGPIYWSILYLIDNAVHHRGQGYVYLRALGIAPPLFWER